MRLRCELVAVLVLASCNGVFGLDPTLLADGGAEDDANDPHADRDRDGVPDDTDPCIASIGDLTFDNEGDGLSNEVDTCPYDYSLLDSDADTIFDDCDPFPMLGGDRVRCTMAFSSAPINRLLWQVRDGDWNLVNLSLASFTPGTLIAGESIEAPVTTSYDVVLYAGMVPAAEAAMTFWLRAGPTASPDDLGCELRGTATSSTLSVRGVPTAPAATIGQGLHRVIKLGATISPFAAAGTPNVRCTAWFVNVQTPIVTSGEAVWRDGRAGVTFETINGVVRLLEIFERDDQPSL